MKLSPAQRQQIFKSHKDGATIVQLCARFHVSADTVRRWIQEGGKTHPCFTDARRTGRPKSLPASERSRVRRLAHGGSTVPKITGGVNKRRQQAVSSSTVRRALKASKEPLQWLPVNTGRVLSAVNKKLRLEFCREHKTSQCGAWLFGDSKLLYCYEDGAGNRRWEWLDPEGKKFELKGGSPYVLHFYAIVGKGYKSRLYFVAPTPPARSKARKGSETFASKHFMAMVPALIRDLERANRFSPRHPLVLDHARQHTSAASRAAMSRQQLRLLEDFPAQGWDLNIIENVWGVLEGKLVQMSRRMPTTPYGWRCRVMEAWKRVEQSTIDKLVAAVPGRMAEVVKQEGSWLRKKAQK